MAKKPNGKAAVERVSTDEVTRYGELCAQLDVLEKDKKKLREKILAARAAGQAMPDDSPFELKFIDQERSTIAWKDEAELLAVEYMSDDERAKWMDAVLGRATVSQVTQVKAIARKEFVLNALEQEAALTA